MSQIAEHPWITKDGSEPLEMFDTSENSISELVYTPD